MEDIKLTEHFSFNELTGTSYTELIDQNRIDAKNRIKQLKYIAGTLEEIRHVLSVPLRVTSGFRNETLNRKVGGSQTSKHKLGLCADIIPIGNMTVKQAFDRIMSYKNVCPSLRKCIIEGVHGSTWLHIQSKEVSTEPTEFFSTNDGKNFTKVV